MQVGSFNFGHMMKTEGFPALWKGIQAAWLREASYTTVKLGGYGPIRDALGAKDKNAPFYLKFAAGSMSGSIGSVLGNPFDVMKTMMMADSSSSKSGPSQGLIERMSKMHKDQGIAGFFRGVEANIMRACVLNGTKMACYDGIKGFVNEQTGWSRKVSVVEGLTTENARALFSSWLQLSLHIYKSRSSPNIFPPFVRCRIPDASSYLPSALVSS
jgi:hypothetical protein